MGSKPGTFEIIVGNSSDDERLVTEINISGDLFIL